MEANKNPKISHNEHYLVKAGYRTSIDFWLQDVLAHEDLFSLPFHAYTVSHRAPSPKDILRNTYRKGYTDRQTHTNIQGHSHTARPTHTDKDEHTHTNKPTHVERLENACSLTQ